MTSTRSSMVKSILPSSYPLMLFPSTSPLYPPPLPPQALLSPTPLLLPQPQPAMTLGHNSDNGETPYIANVCGILVCKALTPSARLAILAPFAAPPEGPHPDHPSVHDGHQHICQREKILDTVTRAAIWPSEASACPTGLALTSRMSRWIKRLRTPSNDVPCSYNILLNLAWHV